MNFSTENKLGAEKNDCKIEKNIQNHEIPKREIFGTFEKNAAFNSLHSDKNIFYYDDQLPIAHLFHCAYSLWYRNTLIIRYRRNRRQSKKKWNKHSFSWHYSKYFKIKTNALVKIYIYVDYEASMAINWK